MHTFGQWVSVGNSETTSFVKHTQKGHFGHFPPRGGIGNHSHIPKRAFTPRGVLLRIFWALLSNRPKPKRGISLSLNHVEKRGEERSPLLLQITHAAKEQWPEWAPTYTILCVCAHTAYRRWAKKRGSTTYVEESRHWKGPFYIQNWFRTWKGLLLLLLLSLLRTKERSRRIGATGGVLRRDLPIVRSPIFYYGIRCVY